MVYTVTLDIFTSGGVPSNSGASVLSSFVIERFAHFEFFCNHLSLFLITRVVDFTAVSGSDLSIWVSAITVKEWKSGGPGGCRLSLKIVCWCCTLYIYIYLL